MERLHRQGGGRWEGRGGGEGRGGEGRGGEGRGGEGRGGGEGGRGGEGRGGEGECVETAKQTMHSVKKNKWKEVNLSLSHT